MTVAMDPAERRRVRAGECRGCGAELPKVPCVACGNDARDGGRGLCNAHYLAVRRAREPRLACLPPRRAAVPARCYACERADARQRSPGGVARDARGYRTAGTCVECWASPVLIKNAGRCVRCYRFLCEGWRGKRRP